MAQNYERPLKIYLFIFVLFIKIIFLVVSSICLSQSEILQYNSLKFCIETINCNEILLLWSTKFEIIIY